MAEFTVNIRDFNSHPFTWNQW